MNISNKKFISLIAASCIFTSSSKCFSQEDYVHNFGLKIDQSINKVWTVQFTEEVDDSAVGNGNISVIDEADNSSVNVTCIKGKDNKSIVVTPPKEGYKNGHTYLINVKKGVKSAKGVNLKREGKLEFKVSEVTNDVHEEGSVIINFKLNNIPKIASNQFAVWIEDLDGNYVRTLYATNFTAAGGYNKRKEALPLWIKQSDWENASKDEIDAVSGATRKPGNIQLTWDCKDKNGQQVKPGKYVYRIEGNIYWSDRVVGKGEIEIGAKENKSEGKIEYVPETAKNSGILIENFHGEYTPKE